MVSNYTLNNIPIEIEMMSNSSRVWIFQAVRDLSPKEIMQTNEYLRLFLTEWTAHSQVLNAHGGVFYNRFISIFLDEENSNSASGCSIDSLTRHVQNIGDQLDVNVLDRENFLFLIDNKIKSINMKDLKIARENKEISDDSLVFNSLVKNKKEFFASWVKPIKDSWHYRFLS